jgi:heterodisulfide reductase subunit D
MPSLRISRIAKAVSNVLENTGISFITLGKEEKCCGQPLLRAGHEGIVDTLAKDNTKAIERTGVKTVITACPGCLRMLKKEYPRFVGDLGFEVLHFAEFFNDVMKKSALKTQGSQNKLRKVTYHDPCDLGMHMGIYDQPREIITGFSNAELIEMSRNREKTWCCGGGNGILSNVFPELSVNMSEDRVKQAKDVGAEIIVTACPNCCILLELGSKKTKAGLEVQDLSEFVSNSLGGSK